MVEMTASLETALLGIVPGMAARVGRTVLSKSKVSHCRANMKLSYAERYEY